MLNEQFIRSLKSFGIFLLSYTALFALFYATSGYTFPFIIAFVIAFLMQPVTRFFRNNLKFRNNIPSLLASISVFIVIFAVLALLFYSIIYEIKQLLTRLPYVNIDVVLKPAREFLNEIGVYFEKIDPSFIEKNSSQLANFLKNGMNILGSSLNTFLSIVLSIPMWITVIFIVILSTYFFSRDMTVIKRKFISVFTDSGKQKIEKVWNQGLKMLTRYIKAYFFIYFLTFIQTLIGFTILGVKYSVLLSIICAIADILPVLGIAVIYLPLSVIYLMTGNYFTGIGIIALFVLISAIRQIVEPKIVSTSLGIHPVATLVAVFIGLKAFGFAGMLYFTFLMVFYKVLKNTRIL